MNLLERFAARCRESQTREPAVTGAVWAGVTTWLVSLLLAAFWAVDQLYHPFVFVYALLLVPGLAAIGTLLGAACGVVVAILRRRRTSEADVRPEYVGELVRRGVIMIATGTALIIIGSIIAAEFEYQKVAKLVALGGTIDSVIGDVSFPDGVLSDHDLPAVVECLNRSKEWYVLNLANTKVTGDGLRHLLKISKEPFRLGLSIEQLNPDGLNHLRRMHNLANFDEINATAAGDENSRDNPQPRGE